MDEFEKDKRRKESMQERNSNASKPVYTARPSDVLVVMIVLFQEPAKSYMHLWINIKRCSE